MPLERDLADGMLHMSILEHLDELRARVIRALLGLAASYLLCVTFAERLWAWVQVPLYEACARTGAKIISIGATEQFSILYMWTPLVAAFFVAAPWVLYQVWAFISPGLYRRERKWAVPFILSMAGLFVGGGAFAYLIVLRYSLVFLVGIGRDLAMERFVSISSYFEMFVNVMLGTAVAFELPVAVFFLTLLRLVTPGFLMRNSRYAILTILILAAVVTPSMNGLDQVVFFVPMALLYFLGVFASYLLVLRREDQRFPWRLFLMWTAIATAAAFLYWRFLVR